MPQSSMPPSTQHLSMPRHPAGSADALVMPPSSPRPSQPAWLIRIRFPDGSRIVLSLNSRGLIGRFLDDLRAAGLHPFERALEGPPKPNVMMPNVPLAIISVMSTPLVVGDARVHSRRIQNDVHVRLLGGPRLSAQSAYFYNVIADLESERVAVERDRCSRSPCGRKADEDVQGSYRHVKKIGCRTRGLPISYRSGEMLMTHDGNPRMRRLGRGTRSATSRRSPREARAERSQRRTADREADLRHAQIAAAQQSHRPLDAACHQVSVRRLAVGEFPRSRLRWPGDMRASRASASVVQRQRVLAVGTPCRVRGAASQVRVGVVLAHVLVMRMIV